ncbi:MAG: tetratricopeptide repeat protein [Acidobacteria bacterium]|nr:tetratricopeptide repeat protein [Acidobacteriota bacterium]
MKPPIRLLILLIFAFSFFGCKAKPGTPAPSGEYHLAERFFDGGEYGKAAEAYEQYLSAGDSLPHQDRALLRLGLSYSFADSPVRDPQKAVRALRRLVAGYPESAYRREAEVILTLQTSVDRLRADVREKDERVKALNVELEQLKKIDMQRPPPRPPR